MDKINPEEYIKILVELEPVFKKAGELALKMRKTALSKNKHNTGVAGIDIVTEADTAVQEFILSEMAKTKLTDCRLFAEEDTESVKKFKGTNGLVLALDPIDGTAIYASTGRFFSTIVSLNDKESVLYTCCHYPLLNWTRRIIKNKIDDFGNLPKVELKDNSDLSKTIAFTVRGPEKMDRDAYNKLVAQGYKFRKVFDITDESGSHTLLFLNQVAGYFNDGPNPYDGLVALHYGKAKNMQIYSTLDMSEPNINDHGPHYTGWYVALKK